MDGPINARISQLKTALGEGLRLTHQRGRIFAKSRVGEKLGSIDRHWDGLQIFLTDSRVEMDTNPVENTARPKCEARLIVRSFFKYL